MSRSTCARDLELERVVASDPDVSAVRGDVRERHEPGERRAVHADQHVRPRHEGELLEEGPADSKFAKLARL